MTTKIDDTELRRRVLSELDWEPALDASSIGVAAKDGIVTLTGTVGSYAEKLNAERAAKRVSGVKAVAEELSVKLPDYINVMMRTSPGPWWRHCASTSRFRATRFKLPSRTDG